MFCGCELSFGDPPNTHTCPTCLGACRARCRWSTSARSHFALMIGMALGCEIAERSIFHRKNYFYPDSPKGYQISQYDVPICRGGQLGDVRIHRVHLEEDAAKLNHIGASGRIHESERSWVDFNRGGTPLVEIVTEPDIHSPAAGARVADAAARDAEAPRRLGRRHVAGLAALRRERVGPAGGLDRARHQDRAEEHELVRVPRARASRPRSSARPGCSTRGEPVVQETLHFDPAPKRLTPLRSKEEAHDYRYFPEPDLVPLLVTDGDARGGARRDPRAAGGPRRAVRARFRAERRPRADQFAFRTELGDYFEAAVGGRRRARQRRTRRRRQLARAARRADQLGRRPGRRRRSRPEALASLATMVAAKEVSRDAAREVLTRLVAEGGDPQAIVEREGLGALSGDDGGLAEIVARAIASDPDARRARSRPAT